MHPDILDRLSSLSRHGDIPHILFHGPRGSGKMALVQALLTKLHGSGVSRMTSERCVVATTASTRQTVEIDARVSNHHIEIRPSDAGANDTYVVQHVIKEMAKNKSIAAVMMNSEVKHRTIVLKGAGDITKRAQAGLRRTMETFSGSCRLILVSTSSCRVIEPLRSRCVLIRVPLPCPDALLSVIAPVVGGSPALAESIVHKSGRSITRAMFMARRGSCEAMVWVRYIDSLCSGIFLEQSPRMILDVRDSFKDLLSAGVPATIVLKTLVYGMLRHDSLKAGDPSVVKIKRSIVGWAAVYEHRLSTGSKTSQVVHLEAFVATFMDLFRTHTRGMFFP